jgi:malonate transporter
LHSVLNVVVPVFALILTGYIAGHRNILGKASSDALNGFVFYFSLPVLLFLAMAKIDTATVLNGPYIAAYLAGQVATLLIGIAVAKGLFRVSLGEAATHGTVGIYGNVGYMGIPLVLTAFGEAALPPVIIATIINAALNIAVLTAVIESERHSGSGGLAIVKVLGSVIRSPILVAPILGFAWALLELPVPAPVQTYGSILGAAAGPCALFSIGLSLVGLPISEGRSEVASMAVLKLIVHPLATWGFAVLWLADQPQAFKICILVSTTLSLLTLSALFYWFIGAT